MSARHANRQHRQRRPAAPDDNRGGADTRSSRNGPPPRSNPRARVPAGGSASGSAAAVPTTLEVAPGAFVSIVLKVDQPTGRQVQGVVGELLTRGNHPRGIKVRLQDGRVGRVQRMAAEAEISNDTGRDTGLAPAVSIHRNPRSPASVRQGLGQEGGDAEPSPGVSLGDYIRRPRGGANASGLQHQTAPVTSEIDAVTICPVCNQFEGDADALQHHINSHFGDG